jgi:hypothetical protein
MGNSKFVSSFNKLPKRKALINSSLQGRTVMEEQYGFTITNTPARVMQVGSITSYTFHIERDSVNSTFFENLVVQNDSIGNTTAHIIKYTPYEPMTSFTEHNSYSFEGSAEFTSIIYDDASISSTGKIITVCRSLWGTRCNANIDGYCVAPSHIPFSICNKQNCLTQQFINETCNTYDDGEPEETPIGGGGSSYGTGGGGTDPIFSDPVCGSNCIEPYEDTIEDPCIELKKLFNTPKPDIKTTIINYMRPNIAVNPSGEIGAGLIKTDSGAFNTRLLQPTTSNQVFIPTGGSFYSGIHTHPLDTYPMFSWTDVYFLYKMNNNLSPINFVNVSFLLVCQDDSGDFQTYVIVFDETFSNTIDNIFNDPENSNCLPEAIAEMMDERLEKKYAKEDELGLRNYERAFLRMMMGYNVSLYKANTDLNNWNKLSLDNLTGTNVNTTPCN